MQGFSSSHQSFPAWQTFRALPLRRRPPDPLLEFVGRNSFCYNETKPRRTEKASPMTGLASTSDLLQRLRDIVGRDAILTSPSELLVYECDGFTIEKNRPDVVVFPTAAEQVARIVGICNE